MAYSPLAGCVHSECDSDVQLVSNGDWFGITEIGESYEIHSLFLTPGSLAIDAGTDVSDYVDPDAFTDDLAQHERSHCSAGNCPDLGCYEY